MAKNTSENPCKMCMPMGGILAFKGVANAMVMLHGAQGCATYMRRHIAEHFNEPVDVASSSLNEKGTVFGGDENLKSGIENMMRLYRPEMVGVLTTCLAETIGEDIDRITSEFLIEQNLEGFPLVPVPTPGYGDSHFIGFFYTTRKIVEKLAIKTSPTKKINLIIPNISPADIREIKRIMNLFALDYTLLPDFSDTLDAPFSRPLKKIPAGGTPVEQIVAMPGARATIQFGMTVEERLTAGAYLRDKFGVPLYNVPTPVGIECTDQFLQLLSEISDVPVPEQLQQERGRLVDAMVDAHKITYQGRAAVFGEPENVYVLARACHEMGTTPVVVATGSKANKLKELLQLYLPADTDTAILTGADFSTIRDIALEKEANIALGNSDGKVLTEKSNIPLIRVGFPVHDRKGGQRILTVGYAGALNLLDLVTNTLLEQKLSRYRQSMYDSFYRQNT
ncbi:nitrogenase component 1 [Dethiobacter alkaliphilus]|uniref:nitrogenase component 1 n=1 Tax=Dethiobacter alkaliphilus TaxID=427926 RepID=UPI0022262F6A|nr:nitrogenase component 1 [Dethiobacter alkaliphilus]MCW3490780.1 nitrogenase [Dethiobacter alkaliphilus]